MKTITVAIGKHAEQRFDLGQEREGDLVEKEVNSVDFDILFKSGWVQEVNHT